MKKFILKNIYFSLPLIFLFYAKPLYLLIGDKYKQTVAGHETYLSIQKSKQKSKSKILIIGDSVGKQLFDNEKKSDSINSLACNQAIGVIGQYLLLDNYIKTGNRPKIVYMVYSPSSFKNNLDQVFTYHYFLKPFFQKEYLGEFSRTAFRQIDKIPYLELCHEPYVLTSNWAPNYKNKDSIGYNFISPITREYLSRIKDLCVSHHIDFYIIPVPTRESNKTKVKSFDKREYSSCNFRKDLTVYLNDVIYLKDSCFIDGLHLKHPYLYKNLVYDLMAKARTHYPCKSSCGV